MLLVLARLETKQYSLGKFYGGIYVEAKHLVYSG